MVLLVKRMPEQDGAPGNLFKGPLFAFVLVMIGLMSLLVTACTLIIEYCDVESAKEVVEKISAKLRKRSNREHWREREAHGDEDSDDVVEIQIDGAPEGKVVGVLLEAPVASAAEGPAPAASGWLSSIAGAKRLAARQARGVPEAKTDGVPEAKTGEAPADEEAKTRAKAPASAPPKKAPPKKPAAKPAARKPPAAAKKRGLFSRGEAKQPKPAERKAATTKAPAKAETTSKAAPQKPAARAPPAAAPAPAAKKRGLFSKVSSVAKAKTEATRQAGKVKSAAASKTEGAVPPSLPPRSIGRDEAEDPADANDDQAVDASATSLWGRTRDMFRGAGALAKGEDAALTEEQEDALAKMFNRMDVSGDGTISVQEAIKALSGARSATSTETQFVRLLGLDDLTRVHHEEGTRRDKLVTKFRALDADGDDTLSYKEFRRVVVEATRADATPDQKLALDP